MNKVFIINGHQYYPFTEGKLYGELVEKAAEIFKGKGYEVKRRFEAHMNHYF